MTEFLDIEPTEQIELLQKIKDSSSFTWLEISKILNVSKGMVSFYKNGFSRIPRKSLEQLVVKTSDVNKVPSIVDAVISSGALVSYINFQVLLY